MCVCISETVLSLLTAWPWGRGTATASHPQGWDRRNPTGPVVNHIHLP